MGLASKYNLHKQAAHAEEIDSEGSWAISYGDMITLLLSFFIIYFTIDPTTKKTENIRLKMSMVKTMNEKSSTVAGEKVDSLNIGDKNEAGIDKNILKEWNGVAHDKGSHVIIEFPGVSFFKTAATEVTPEGVDAIKKFVSVYMPYAGNYFVGIRAFADRRTVSKRTSLRFHDNLELTALRSVSTMRILQKSGIPLSRIRVGGHGEHITTAAELAEIPEAQRSPAAELDLARKVILVIEKEILDEKK